MAIPQIVLFFLVCLSIEAFSPADAREAAYVVYLGPHLHAHEDSIDHEMVADSHRNLLASALGRERAGDAIFVSYTKVINGFAANLDEEEARELARHPDVLSIFPNKGRKMRGDIDIAKYLGLEDSHRMVPPGSLWANTKFGEDVIIGVLDSGVKSEEANFNDEGYTPIPLKWRGVCQNGTIPLEEGGVRCNKKLIGARSYDDGLRNHVRLKRHENTTAWDAVFTSNFFTPRDTNGHGTLTMSLAASSQILEVYAGSERPVGAVQGIAPAARLAAYKIGYENLPDESNCFDADILAGFDSAIHDGVDVISVSFGSDDLDGDLKDMDGAVAIGSFHALMRGIPTVTCQGNLDFIAKDYKYQDNAIPWVLSVGATFMNKQYLAEVTFGNNKTYVGASLYDADVEPLPRGKSFPLVRSPCENGSFHPDLVKGKVVVCVKGDVANALVALKEAGSVGVVFLDVNDNYPSLSFGSLPYVEVLVKDLSNDTIDYILHDPSPVTSFTHTHVRFGRPYVGHFSIPGPNKNNPEILKPDVVAPGVVFNITESGLKRNEIIPGTSFSAPVIYGTSFSTPITAGVVALLRSLHPDWSTSAIKSAVMTTARRVTKRINGTSNIFMTEPPPDVLLDSTPLDAGAGQIDPTAAADPGLVYDITVEEYLNFLCSQGFNSSLIGKFALKPHSCPCPLPRVIDMNYPAIVVPDYTERITVVRRLKNVGMPGTYKVTVDMPPHVKVRVLPKMLEFAAAGEEKAFSVTFEATRPFNVSYGSITWRDGVHKVRSPLVLWAKSHTFLLPGSPSYREH